MSDKRSSEWKNAQPDLFEGGVGARQEDAPPPAGGGGYLETCRVLNFSARPPAQKNGGDPRLNELEQMGLQAVWLNVAAEIGVDAFLTMWRVVDGDPASHNKEGFIQISLKNYRSYLRYQRNRYIESLAAQGLKPLDIRRYVARHFRESVSYRHISRISCGDKLG